MKFYRVSGPAVTLPMLCSDFERAKMMIPAEYSVMVESFSPISDKFLVEEFELPRFTHPAEFLKLDTYLQYKELYPANPKETNLIGWYSFLKQDHFG